MGFSVQKVYEVFLQSSGQSYCSEPVHPHAVHSNERVNPPHGPPKLFYSHAPGSTLVTLETACVPPARITFPWSGTQDKKYKWHMFFWNNNKILFLGLSPPQAKHLALFPTFQPLIPCLLCGNSVPLHSFIVVGLHLVVFTILLNALHTYKYKIKPLASNPQALWRNNHISPLAYINLAHQPITHIYNSFYTSYLQLGLALGTLQIQCSLGIWLFILMQNRWEKTIS